MKNTLFLNFNEFLTHIKSIILYTLLLSNNPEVSLFVITSGFVIKIFSQVTFTVLHISFVNTKGYFDWQKPSHVTFSPRFFCLLSFYCKVFNQLKNKHCNINIKVSFSCPTVVEFYSP